MTLTTHALVGAAAAQFFPSHPVLAFTAGFASHFLMDSLPHWDYSILSSKHHETHPMEQDMNVYSREFLIDLFRIGCDALLGVALSVLIFTSFFHSTVFLAILGAVAGILPDPLQFAYFKFRYEPLISLQKFHVWIQEGRSLYISPIYGVGLQIAILLVVLTLTKYLTGA